MKTLALKKLDEQITEAEETLAALREQYDRDDANNPGGILRTIRRIDTYQKRLDTLKRFKALLEKAAK